VKRLVVATTNSHKVAEFQSALASLTGWEVVVQPDSVPSVEETGATFVDNAILKATHTSGYVPDLVVADDSGLCIDALDGRPGVFSNRYARTDPERIGRVLQEMIAVPDGSRGAAFVCALALAQNGNVLWTGEGRVEGTIARKPRGTNGFGYDPIFYIQGPGRTMAELTAAAKNRISHRGRALELLVRHFVASGRL
jgi:XTP/dITP diphosphohydrolase